MDIGVRSSQTIPGQTGSESMVCYARSMPEEAKRGYQI